MALPETMNVWHVSCLTPTHRLGVTPTGRSMPVRGRAVPALRDSATAVPRAIVDGTQGAEHPAIAGDDEHARNQGVTGVSQEESDSPNAWTEPRQAPAMPQGNKQPTRGLLNGTSVLAGTIGSAAARLVRPIHRWQRGR